MLTMPVLRNIVIGPEGTDPRGAQGMPDDSRSPKPPEMLSRGRMEAFSDGVLAIAITLLVLDLAVRPPGTPLEQFLNAWPSYLAYVVSFLTIGAAWIAHNALTDRLDHADVLLLRLNLLFLMVVAFLPFPTGLVADALNEETDAERIAVVVYGLTLLAIRVTFVLMDRYSRRARLLLPTDDDPDLQEERRKVAYVVSGYAITVLLGVAVPILAVVLYFALAIVLVIPFRTVARLFSGTYPDNVPDSRPPPSSPDESP